MLISSYLAIKKCSCSYFGFIFSAGSLPTISPSCIPSAGASPLPQFNAAFTNWETPPYSPTAAAASYRAPFTNTGKVSRKK